MDFAVNWSSASEGPMSSSGPSNQPRQSLDNICSILMGPPIPSILRHLNYWILDFKSQGCGSKWQDQGFGGIEQQSIIEKHYHSIQATSLASSGFLALPMGSVLIIIILIIMAVKSGKGSKWGLSLQVGMGWGSCTEKVIGCLVVNLVIHGAAIPPHHIPEHKICVKCITLS